MKTSCEPSADITLTSPADLVSAIPYLVGYVPRDSLVVVGLARKHIAVTLRVDLPAADQPVTRLAITPDVLRRNDVEAAVLAGYGTPDRVTRCVDHVRKLLESAGIQLVEALRVTEGRYWSYVCREPACCPPEGKLVNGTDSAVATTFAFGGMQALPDRTAVAAQLKPVTGNTRAAVTRATNQVRKLLAEGGAMVSARDTLREEGYAIMDRSLAAERELPSVRDTVRLGFALTDADVQTKAMVLTDQRGPHNCLDLWLWLTRHLAPAFRAIPAALLAFTAWRCGNGALATEAVRRAQSDDPKCYLAGVLAHLLDKGIPPGSVPRIKKTRRELPAPAGRAGAPIRRLRRVGQGGVRRRPYRTRSSAE